MKPLTSWLAWLAKVGLAGSCLVWAGCGGSDVPDPDSDTRAASSSTPAPAPAALPPAAIAQNEAAATPAAPTAPPVLNPAAAMAPGAMSAPAASATATGPAGAPAATAAEATGETAADKGDAASATSEMLSLASAPAASGEKAAGDDKSAAGPATGAGMAMGMPGMTKPAGAPMGMPGMANPGAMPSAANMTPGAAAPGLAPMTNMNMPNMPAAGANGAAINYGAMASAMPGAAGNPGGPGGIAVPGAHGGAADYRSAYGAVEAFLHALHAKDPERLAEAIALRAPTEASPQYRKIFTAISDQSLAPEELEELAQKFAGMRIVGQNEVKSTGKFGVIVGKSLRNGSQATRTITARREKTGWKVFDISGQRDYSKSTSMPRTGRVGSSR